MTRIIIFIYGIVAYAIFFVTFLYAIGFVAGVAVPKTIDSGPAVAPLAAISIDLLLLGLFAVQHSGMARKGFKRRLSAWLPQAAERSTYVLLSSLALILLYLFWQPLPAVIWSAETFSGQALLYALCALGWMIVFTGTFMINHFDLFGLRQVWLNLRRRDDPEPQFKIVLFYRLVRHPLMLGFLIAFWATPHMTIGHLLFACATTAYILLALQLEERDLISAFGGAYRNYQRRVPMLLPLPRKRPKLKPDLTSGRHR